MEIVGENTHILAVIGFGISVSQQAETLTEIADGMIVSSAIIKPLAPYGKDVPCFIGTYMKKERRRWIDKRGPFFPAGFPVPALSVGLIRCVVRSGSLSHPGQASCASLCLLPRTPQTGADSFAEFRFSGTLEVQTTIHLCFF